MQRYMPSGNHICILHVQSVGVSEFVPCVGSLKQDAFLLVHVHTIKQLLGKHSCLESNQLQKLNARKTTFLPTFYNITFSIGQNLVKLWNNKSFEEKILSFFQFLEKFLKV